MIILLLDGMEMYMSMVMECTYLAYIYNLYALETIFGLYIRCVNYNLHLVCKSLSVIDYYN